MARVRAFALAAVCSLFVLTACAGDDVEIGSVAGRSGGKPLRDAREVEVTASNFQFEPARIQIGATEEVALALRSDDGPHDFAVDGLGLVDEVGGGETDIGRLRIDTPGRYTFFCTLPGHRDGGMEGTIVVR